MRERCEEKGFILSEKGRLAKKRAPIQVVKFIPVTGKTSFIKFKNFPMTTATLDEEFGKFYG